MKIRTARLEEIPEIMKIYDAARRFMQEHENPTQWKAGYPSRELVERDCKQGWLYVCEEQEVLAGVFMFCTEPDATYQKIYEGKWIQEGAYGTMHRMASSGQIKGVASFCLDWCFKQCGNVRGDTHEDNYVMQCVFEKMASRGVESSMWRMERRELLIRESNKGEVKCNYQREISPVGVAAAENIRNAIGLLMKN